MLFLKPAMLEASDQSSHSQGELALELKGVSKDYPAGGGSIRVVQNVNLLIRRGTFTVLVGASGCGKSTLLHLMGGLDRPTSGSIWLEQKELGKLTDRELSLVRRRRLGFVFQFFSLLPNLPTWLNIALPLLIDGVAPPEARQKASALADRVGLGHRLDSKAGLLSGGEMQRAALARALIHGPTVVLADEPTGNLDSQTGLAVLTLMRELVDEGSRTLVMVTHDAAATRFGDRTIRLKDGQVLDAEPTGNS
jgi:putative ABC transport system ATP-binding protein